MEQFEKIETPDQIYAFIEKLQTERIWVPAGERSPNWPVGLTRVVQHRVKTPAWCDHRGMSANSANVAGAAAATKQASGSSASSGSAAQSSGSSSSSNSGAQQPAKASKPAGSQAT